MPSDEAPAILSSVSSTQSLQCSRPRPQTISSAPNHIHSMNPRFPLVQVMKSACIKPNALRVLPLARPSVPHSQMDINSAPSHSFPLSSLSLTLAHPHPIKPSPIHFSCAEKNSTSECSELSAIWVQICACADQFCAEVDLFRSEAESVLDRESGMKISEPVVF